MDFTQIVGHQTIINNLKNIIIKNNIGHSYLFEGTKSIGKSMVAEVFAKALLCEKQLGDPCNSCSACVKFDSGNYPDVYINKPDGETFKKEQIDAIQKSINILPYEGQRKIYILEDIDKITKQAQNSFLKTLEEPPQYVTILMTVTNSHSLLPTIISRCQVLKFSPLEQKEIINLLINTYQKSEDEAKIISSFSNGIVGKAIDIAQSNEFKDMREELITIIDEIINCDKVRLLTLREFFNSQKEGIEEILDLMVTWFRDVLILKELNNDHFTINKDKISLLSSHSLKLSKRKIYEIIEIINNTKMNIISNVNYDLAIEVMFLTIQEV